MATQKNASQKGKFYDQIISALIKNFCAEGQAPNQKIGCIVIGSPGFTRENFSNYLREYADKKQNALLKDLVAKSILCHCSTGY